jgi:hypothetical protein
VVERERSAVRIEYAALMVQFLSLFHSSPFALTQIQGFRTRRARAPPLGRPYTLRMKTSTDSELLVRHHRRTLDEGIDQLLK